MATDKSTLSTAVVEALANWTSVELQLSQLFAILADFQRIDELHQESKAYTIFDTIISFETRLAIVSALMEEEAVNPLERETWNRLAAKLSKLYKKRHALAHFTLSHKEGSPKEDADKWDYKISPFFNRHAEASGKVWDLALSDITERDRIFGQAAAVIGFVAFEAAKRRGQIQDNPMQENPPSLYSQLQASASLILEARVNKPQSSP